MSRPLDSTASRTPVGKSIGVSEAPPNILEQHKQSMRRFARTYATLPVQTRAMQIFRLAGDRVFGRHGGECARPCHAPENRRRGIVRTPELRVRRVVVREVCDQGSNDPGKGRSYRGRARAAALAKPAGAMPVAIARLADLLVVEVKGIVGRIATAPPARYFDPCSPGSHSAASLAGDPDPRYPRRYCATLLSHYRTWKIAVHDKSVASVEAAQDPLSISVKLTNVCDACAFE